MHRPLRIAGAAAAACLAASMVVPSAPRGFAQDARPDSFEMRLDPPGPERRTPPKLERAAFLGVVTAPATPVLRQQLKLPNGIGLVVDFVESGSPAETAGLRTYDILHKLNDQLLVNPQQLAVLVRTFKGGDEVSLTVLRAGAPINLKAKLSEKDLRPIEDVVFIWGGPGGRIHMEGPIAAARGIPPHAPRVTVSVPAETTTTLSDGAHDLKITTKGDHQHLLAKDKSGRVLFDGPINTQEQRARIPQDVRDKLTIRPPADAPAREEGGEDKAPESGDVPEASDENAPTTQPEPRGGA